jgi:hypothetical protein
MRGGMDVVGCLIFEERSSSIFRGDFRDKSYCILQEPR